ncbi:hypothetical protein SynBIOSU31_03360 [Synechococcus sp. BIOS-U3-1]|nr:hypothetical protein SynBIOSU31_03360 [Synechococcus sp. BIOS-U3-1]
MFGLCAPITCSDYSDIFELDEQSKAEAVWMACKLFIDALFWLPGFSLCAVSL